MRARAKMMMLTSRDGASAYGEGRDGQRGNVNYARMNYSESNRMEDDRMYGNAEARRRRDSRGRFMRSAYDDMEDREEWPMEDRRMEMRRGGRYSNNAYDGGSMHVIGFGRTDGDYRSEMHMPEMMEANHMRGGEMQRGRGTAKRHTMMDMGTAVKWVEQMQGADGSRGAYFGVEQVKALMKSRGLNDIPLPEFWAVMNMLHSDYGEVLQKHNVGDSPEIYADLAKAFIHDKDAVANKVSAYYACIVEGE